MYKQLSYILSLGGFHLTKWICIRREVLALLPSCELQKNCTVVVLRRYTTGEESIGNVVEYGKGHFLLQNQHLRPAIHEEMYAK